MDQIRKECRVENPTCEVEFLCITHPGRSSLSRLDSVFLCVGPFGRLVTRGQKLVHDRKRECVPNRSDLDVCQSPRTLCLVFPEKRVFSRSILWGPKKINARAGRLFHLLHPNEGHPLHQDQTDSKMQILKF